MTSVNVYKSVLYAINSHVSRTDWTQHTHDLLTFVINGIITACREKYNMSKNDEDKLYHHLCKTIEIEHEINSGSTISYIKYQKRKVGPVFIYNQDFRVLSGFINCDKFYSVESCIAE